MIAAGAAQRGAGVVLHGQAPFRTGVVDDKFPVQVFPRGGRGLVVQDADERGVEQGDDRIAGPGSIGAVVVIADEVQDIGNTSKA